MVLRLRNAGIDDADNAKIGSLVRTAIFKI